MKKFIRYILVAGCALGLASLALAQSATSTPPAPPQTLFRPEELNINPAGRFLTHGMIIQSVTGNSFVGKVWGTSWTINVANMSELKFFLQNGAGVSQTTLSNVLKPGDEVGVSGWVDSGQALTVNGQVVRDYSLGNAQEFEDRETEMENEQGNKNENGGSGEMENRQNNNEGQGEGEKEHGGTSRGSSPTNQQTIGDIQQQIKNILEQIKLLQEKKVERL